MKLQNIIDCSNNDAIMSSIKCELKSCLNKAEWCYIVDNVHLKILPAHIKTWSIAINDGTATLDMGPAILVKSLMPEILPAHIKTWSIAINDGTATLDMGPAILVKSLMPAK